MANEFDFIPGDIIELAGECYQVMENLGERGIVRPFPSDDESGFSLDWHGEGDSCRRIGNAALPAPSPCSTGGSCPTYTIEPAVPKDPNIIARQR